MLSINLYSREVTGWFDISISLSAFLSLLRVALLDLSRSSLNVVAFCLLPFVPTITSPDEFQMNCPARPTSGRCLEQLSSASKHGDYVVFVARSCIKGLRLAAVQLPLRDSSGIHRQELS